MHRHTDYTSGVGHGATTCSKYTVKPKTMKVAYPRGARPLMHLAAEDELRLCGNAITVADPEEHLVKAREPAAGLLF
jgi:hypothetical protein